MNLLGRNSHTLLETCPVNHLPSNQISVREYDLVLLFPFALRYHDDHKKDKRGAQRLDDWVKAIEQAYTVDEKPRQVWEELTQPYPDLNDPNCPTQYAEWVYFHPFIRSFLYTSKNDRLQEMATGQSSSGKSVRVLRHKDFVPNGAHTGRLEVEWFGLEGPCVLHIRNVHLYLFDTGVGIVSFEFCGASATLNLHQTLNLQDKVRRLFAPYFERFAAGTDGEQEQVIAGHCPERLSLFPANPELPATITTFGQHRHAKGQPNAVDPATQEGHDVYKAHLATVHHQCEPPMVSVWERVLYPLTPRKLTPQQGNFRFTFEQILDERMPLMSYLAVNNPREISVGDWMRLATVDDAGNSNCYPYGPEFCGENGLKPFAYDRFWTVQQEAPANPGMQNTRWLCCGYGFTSVGCATSSFFTDASIGARAHFRYHYLKMFLIGHFHRASLLRFKGQLAEAVEELQQSIHQRDRALEQFAATLERIQLDLLAFRNMYWFTEISNQVQAQELFDLLSKHLRTRELFSQVFEESEKAAAIVRAYRDRIQNDRTARLGVLAAVFLVAAPTISAIFTTEEIAKYYRAWGACLASFAALLAGLVLTKPLTKMVDAIKGKCKITWTVVGMFSLAIGAAWIVWNKPKPDEKPSKESPMPVQVVPEPAKD